MMVSEALKDLSIPDQFDFLAVDVESLSDTLIEASIAIEHDRDPLLRTIVLGLCAVSEHLSMCAEDARKAEQKIQEVKP